MVRHTHVRGPRELRCSFLGPSRPVPFLVALIESLHSTVAPPPGPARASGTASAARGRARRRRDGPFPSFNQGNKEGNTS